MLRPLCARRSRRYELRLHGDVRERRFVCPGVRQRPPSQFDTGVCRFRHLVVSVEHAVSGQHHGFSGTVFERCVLPVSLALRCSSHGECAWGPHRRWGECGELSVRCRSVSNGDVPFAQQALPRKPRRCVFRSIRCAGVCDVSMEAPCLGAPLPESGRFFSAACSPLSLYLCERC